MAFFVIPSRRTRQPQGGVQPSASFSRGLVWLPAWSGGGFVDVARNAKISAIAGVTTNGFTPFGGAVDFSASQVLSSSIANIAYPVTMMAVFYRAGTAPDMTLLSLSSPSLEYDYLQLCCYSGAVEAISQSIAHGFIAASSPTTVAANKLHVAFGVFASATSRIAWIDGVAGTEDTRNCTPGALDSMNAGAVRRYGAPTTDAGTHSLLLGVVWNRGLPGSEISALSRNPWQLFASSPRRIYFGAGAGGGAVTGTASIAPSPQTLTSSGSVAVGGTLNKTPSAQTLTASGTVVSGVVGTASITPASQTATATSTVAVAATASVTAAAQTLTSSGAVTGGTVTGTASITSAAQTLTGSASVSGGAVTGTASITPTAQTVIAAGNIIVLATANITPAAQTLTASEEGLLPEDIPDTSKYIDRDSPRIGMAPNIKRRGDPTHGTGKITRPRLG